MTINEAIERYISNAEYERTHGNLQGCLEFKQLANWLKDYKRLLEQNNSDENCISTEPKKIDEWDICGKSAELWIVNGKIQIRHRGTIHNVVLPSIQSKVKTGHWIYKNDKPLVISPLGYYMCDICSKGSSLDKTKYCPNCGAKMEVEQ